MFRGVVAVRIIHHEAVGERSPGDVKMQSNLVPPNYLRINPARKSKRINEELFVECMGILQREN